MIGVLFPLYFLSYLLCFFLAICFLHDMKTMTWFHDNVCSFSKLIVLLLLIFFTLLAYFVSNYLTFYKYINFGWFWCLFGYFPLANESKLLQIHLSFIMFWCLCYYASLYLANQHFCQYIYGCLFFDICLMLLHMVLCIMTNFCKVTYFRQCFEVFCSFLFCI